MIDNILDQRHIIKNIFSRSEFLFKNVFDYANLELSIVKFGLACNKIKIKNRKKKLS